MQKNLIRQPLGEGKIRRFYLTLLVINICEGDHDDDD